MPTYLNDALQQLEWSDGTYIPASNEENKLLEELRDKRTNELEKLREEYEIQEYKQKELYEHRKNIQIEHQENMQLIAVYKEQLQNEDHYVRLSTNELSQFITDSSSVDKQCKEICERTEHVQADIAKILRRVELLRSTIGEEQGSLDEWRIALQRSEADIKTINNFNKEDENNISALEIKRQRLKLEHDKKHVLLSELCGNLYAEEKGAERISEQVTEALNNRRHIVSTWASTVEKLRQRDNEIKTTKEELQMLKDFASSRLDYVNEKEEFLNMQKVNNNEVNRELNELKNLLSNKRQHFKYIEEAIKMLNSELICSKRELVNTSNELTNCRSENRRIIKEIQSKQDTVDNLNLQITKYKEKLSEILDGSKTAAQRIKQLEDMLNNEEKYIHQIILENERMQNRIFNSQQHLLALKNETNTCDVECKAIKASIDQIEGSQTKTQKDITISKENLYNVNYQLEMAMSRLAKLEGDIDDSIDHQILQERAQQLMTILQEKRARSSLLQTQMIKLESDLRLITRNISSKQNEYEISQERLHKVSAEADGAVREESNIRKIARNHRADESNLQLRVECIKQALKKLSNESDSFSRAHLDLHAAVDERIAEVNERQNVLITHRRILQKERSSLNTEIKNEQCKMEQLKKRYDIHVSALGKDESGQAFSVAYFKVKYAQEKSELQQKGDTLDAQIRQGEQEIAALEATLHVVDAANRKFMRNLDTVKDDDPEMLEFNALNEVYNNTRLHRSQIVIQARQHSKMIEHIQSDIVEIKQQAEELQSIKDDLMDELMMLKKDLKEQIDKLNRANNLRKKSGASVRRKIKSSEIWTIHEKDIHTKVISEANRSASTQLCTMRSSIVDKRAFEYGVNLPQVYSAPPAAKTGGSISDRNSLLSQESWMQASVSSKSGNSVCEDFSDTSQSKDNPQSHHSSQTSISHKFEKRQQLMDLKNLNENSTQSTLMPISVVMIGMDTLASRKNTTDSKKSKFPMGKSTKNNEKSSSILSKDFKK